MTLIVDHSLKALLFALVIFLRYANHIFTSYLHKSTSCQENRETCWLVQGEWKVQGEHRDLRARVEVLVRQMGCADPGQS